MKPAILAPRGMAASKSPHGAPCNSCGLCCLASLCPLGAFVFGRELGRCPALEFDQNGSVCGLVAHPMAHAMARTLEQGVPAMSEAARHLIGSGTGCDARINDEPPNEAFYAELAAIDRRTRPQTKHAKKVWGIR